MIAQPTETLITATTVPQNRRMLFLPRLFGALFLAGENHVYSTALKLSKDYSGGSWAFKELSTGGGYMVPECAETLSVSVSGNWFEGELSADAAGIVFTLFTLNALIWHTHSKEATGLLDKLVLQFERLQQYARQHAESHLIFAAID